MRLLAFDRAGLLSVGSRIAVQVSRGELGERGDLLSGRAPLGLGLGRARLEGAARRPLGWFGGRDGLDPVLGEVALVLPGPRQRAGFRRHGRLEPLA